MTAREWELVFPWPRPLLNANQRMHWAQKATITRQVRGAGELMMRDANIPALGRVEIGLDWYVKDRRRRDPDNLFPTYKALADALVDAEIVPDDTPEYVTRLMPRIVSDPYTEPRIILTVKELA